jgi:hypothetical protein
MTEFTRVANNGDVNEGEMAAFGVRVEDDEIQVEA